MAVSAVEGSSGEMASDECWVGEDCWVGEGDLALAATGLWRGEVRNDGERGAGCVSTPGRGMSKERSVALAEVCCVKSGVRRKLCSG